MDEASYLGPNNFDNGALDRETQNEDRIRKSICCDDDTSDDKTSLKGVSDELESNSSASRKNSSSSHSDLETAFQLLFDTSRGSTPGGSCTPHDAAQATNLINGIDVLLQRLTNERFLELRRIQLGDRPVSGTHARESLENFFQRAIHGPTIAERISEEEQNRPNAVTNDVQNLLQQGLVNATLQNNFRQHLERTLSARQPPSNTPTSRPARERRTRGSVVNSQFRSQLETLFQSRIGSNNFRPELRRNGSTQNRNIGNQMHRQPRPSQQNSRSSQVSVNQQQTHSSTQPSSTTQEMAQEDTTRLRITIESGMELLTQTIAEDLNRLQSLQVVSNMMRSGFREDLEDMVQQRASDNGITETPDIRREILRNRSARTSDISENADMNSEILSLRRQLDEMKRMMAMSLEMQMDTQRAIKQEVAAVCTSFMQHMFATQTSGMNVSPHGNSQTMFSPPQPTPPASAGQCIICVERTIDSVLYQCGHMCVCNYCGLQLKMNGNHCPMCRAPIRDVIRAYQTQSDV